jgi:hypothetical protein
VTLDLSAYDTDKDEGYIATYEAAFAGLRDEPIRLLELGVYTGGSLLMWADFFPRATITGLDQRAVEIGHPRIRVVQGDQADTALLTSIAPPQGFDVIVDDASHLAGPTAASFWHLFEHHLRPGGIYAIEDWGTGYFPHRPDGRRYRGTIGRARGAGHTAGMVGFVKQLVDACAAPDITLHAPRAAAGRARVQTVQVSNGQCLVFKAPGH